jgi:hypothetical protein
MKGPAKAAMENVIIVPVEVLVRVQHRQVMFSLDIYIVILVEVAVPHIVTPAILTIFQVKNVVQIAHHIITQAHTELNLLDVMHHVHM